MNKKDMDAQFLCNDCARYNLCEYYHRRKKDSYICKYFHYEKQEQSGDLISREETLTAFADYVGSGMSMDDYDALWNIVVKMPPVNPQEPILDKIRAEIDNVLSDGMIHKQTVLGIIDKYKAESEEV
jgi:hypothetical protein